MVSRVQLSATTSRPLVLRQDPDADLSRYTTTGKGKTHGGMTTGDSHMGFKTASTVCPIKSQLIHLIVAVLGAACARRHGCDQRLVFAPRAAGRVRPSHPAQTSAKERPGAGYG